jgi:DNA-binding IclR family transcriptional regulator
MANAPAARQALTVLRLLARHTEPIPASAIARDLNLPRSSVYHLLSVLCEQGFVSHLAEERRYGLGVAAFELGSAYSRQAPLQRLGRQLLVHLVDSTKHNAHLAVLHGRDVLYVIEERAPGRQPLVTDVGVRLPSQLTASGLAMLAALPPQQVRALFPSRDAFVQRHGVGPTTLPALRALLSRVRQDGFALEDGTVTPDFASVAAPVRDHSGHPVAGIAVTYRTAEVTVEQRQIFIQEVIQTATDLTHRVRGRA